MEVYTKSQLDTVLNDAESIEDLREKLSNIQSYEIDTISAQEDDVIIISYPPEDDVAEEIVPIVRMLQGTYPNNPVIGLVKDVDVLISYPDEALEMLDNMKAKISILKDTKPSIVLT